MGNITYIPKTGENHCYGFETMVDIHQERSPIKGAPDMDPTCDSRLALKCKFDCKFNPEYGINQKINYLEP